MKQVRQDQIAAGIAAEGGARQPGGAVHWEDRKGAAGDLADIEIPEAAQPAGREDDGAVIVHQATRPSSQTGSQQERRDERLVASIHEAAFDTRCTPPGLRTNILEALP